MTEWRPVLGYEGIYEVRTGADGGRVRRVKALGRTYVGRELGGVGHDGYARVVLSKPGSKPRYVRLHTVILEAFVGPAPPSCEVCHKDDDRLNNTFPNLYWGTRSNNVTDAYRNAKRVAAVKCGEAHPNAKLSDAQRHEIRRRKKAGEHAVALAVEFSVAPKTIYQISSTHL